MYGLVSLEAEAAKTVLLGPTRGIIFCQSSTLTIHDVFLRVKTIAIDSALSRVSISNFLGDFSYSIDPDEFDAPRDAHPPYIS